MGNNMNSKFNVPFGIGVFRREEKWKIVNENDGFCQHVGYSHDELRSIDDILELFVPKFRTEFCNLLERFVAGEVKEELSAKIMCSGGETKWTRVSCIDGDLLDDKVVLLFSFIQREKQLEQKLELLQKQYRMIEEVSDEIPFDLDVLEWKILRSKRLMEARGVLDAGDNYYNFADEIKEFHPMDQEKLVTAMKEAAGEKISGTIDVRYNIAQDNMVQKYAWYRIHYKSIKGEDGKIIRVIGRWHDVEKDLLLEEKAKRDPLTKLLNKIEVQTQVSEALKNPGEKPSVLFLIDIDNFKGINDTFGHTFGDTVISDIANILSRQFRAQDIVGRVGGDEFLVFMKNVSVEKAEMKARNLCRALTKEYSGGDVVRKITTSIGLSVSGIDGNTYNELFDNADRAMYRTKQSGKNGYSIARGQDLGPIRKNKKQDEKRADLKDSDKDFMMFAVNLLTHARNVDGSLNLLLQKMCEEYSLDMIVLCEDASNSQYALVTNYYSELINIYDRILIAKNGIEDGLPKYGKAVIVDNAPVKKWIESAERQGSVIPNYLENNISVAACRFEFSANKAGSLFFFRFGSGKEWQSAELDFLGEMSRTIALFVTLRTRLEESNTEIRKIQNRDQLTGLATLEAFKSVFANVIPEIPKEKVKALCYFDINNFGYINENYGHQVGDRVLKFLAQDIAEQDYFVMASRLYSDFFLFLAVGDNKEELQRKITTQQKKFTNMQNHQYPSSGLSITTGMYFIESDKVDLELAIENANLAWKNAKKIGKREIEVFEDGLRETRVEEQQIIAEFYEALYRADFEVFLQPKFDLLTREVYGAEALSRWRKPDGHVYYPQKYIDVLEKIGYITELDFYIYEEVLKLMTKWRQQHKREMVVSVNFSGRHFDGDGKDFLNRITTITNKYIIEPKYIEIEITEGVIAKNHEGLLRCLNLLREKGFRVSIDDFGTGYSSLFVLTEIPADVVKFDKSFMDKEINQRNVAMIKAMGEMVSVAEKDIIFEGIETEEQCQTLVECGFKYGQGYLCNKPVSVVNFEKLYLQ